MTIQGFMKLEKSNMGTSELGTPEMHTRLDCGKKTRKDFRYVRQR